MEEKMKGMIRLEPGGRYLWDVIVSYPDNYVACIGWGQSETEKDALKEMKRVANDHRASKEYGTREIEL